MNIKRINKNALDRSCKTDITEPDILKASDLLYDLINHSYETSNNALCITINEHEEDLQSLYWKCKDNLEKVNAADGKIDFLAMNMLEDTWRKVKPLILVRIEEMLSGDMSQIEKAMQLQELFNNNPYSKMWKEKSYSYICILEDLGFDTSKADFSDLTEIMEPLLDAFTFYQKAINIFQVRKGSLSDATPVLMQEVCIYHSFIEFADTIMSCEKDSVIAFGGIVLTEGQCDDYFYEWENGFPCERHRNISKYESLSKSDFQSKEHSRSMWLAVRNGGNLWMYRMPYSCEGYKTSPDCQRDKYYYGKRAGYAPYEVFFKDMFIEDKNTTMLSIPKKGYRLSDFMDVQQMVWLPVFLEETVSYFYRKEPSCEYGYFPEEERINIGSYEVMPVGCNFVATKSLIHSLPNPEDVLTSEASRFWISYFHVSKDNLKDVPLLQGAYIRTEKKAKETLEDLVKRAYCKIIEEKLSDYIYENIWKVREEMVSFIRNNGSQIIEKAMNGEFAEFSEITIDKNPILDENGQPKMETSWRKTKPMVEHTSSDDAKDRSGSSFGMGKMVLWNGDRTESKPPVVIRLRPKTKSDYAALLGCKPRVLPDFINLIDYIHTYGEERHMSDRDYGRNGHRHNNEKSIAIPCIVPINICMKKSAWNKGNKK